MTSDDKILWLLQKNWLYAPFVKHEVFKLLESAYPEASQGVRLKLLERVRSGPYAADSESPDDKAWVARRTYDLLHWLHEIAPDCALAAQAFGEIQDAYPSLQPSEHPDLDHWISSMSGVVSPKSLEELLGLDPDKEIDWLLTYQGDAFAGPDREGLLAMTRQAITKDASWGLRLAAALETKNNWDSDLWYQIFRGFQESILSEVQWESILTLLSTHPQLLESFAGAVSDLLENGVSKRNGKIPLKDLALAEEVADKVWDAGARKSDEQKALEVSDWVTEAINHYGGRLALFWLRVLSKRASEEAKGEGIPQEYKKRFETIITGESYAAELGRVILVSQLHFLFALDCDWSRSNVLPLLNWKDDQKRAQQAWHGFLACGRWHEGILNDLLPYYEQTFTKLTDALSDMKDRFCEHLANISVFSSSNPIEGGWLLKFMATVRLEERIKWASQITYQLRLVSTDSARENLWNRWLDDYWGKRITGSPRPLEMGEMEEMVEWATHLGSVFPKAVSRICESPAPRLIHTLLYAELAEKNIPGRYPDSVTDLLLCLLPHADKQFYHCDKVGEIVKVLVDLNTSREKLLQICSELSRLRCPNASELKALAENR